MVVDTGSRQTVWKRTRSIWSARRVLVLLIRRDLKSTYASSRLGYLWAVLDPLLMAGVYWLVFTKIFHRTGVGAEPYIVFLVSGLLPWQWFTQTVKASGNALSGSAKLIRAQNLPREVWVLRQVLAGAVSYVFALPVLVVFVVTTGAHLTWHVLLTPVAVLTMIVLLTGLGLMLAPLVVLVADLEHIVTVVMRFLFYGSPIIYSFQDLPGPLRAISLANPVTGILGMFRSAFFPEEFQPATALWSVGVAVVVLAMGWAVFARLERTVLKEI